MHECTSNSVTGTKLFIVLNTWSLKTEVCIFFTEFFVRLRDEMYIFSYMYIFNFVSDEICMFFLCILTFSFSKDNTLQPTERHA